MSSYKTAKGTELPLLNLRGKDYLEVKYRLVWFREEHPNWSIETELKSVTDKSAYARATIKDEAGRIIATSHKYESIQGFPDYIEKAETGSIGRALALIGYGTQFCADELDEGQRVVDAPAERPRMKSVGPTSVKPAPAEKPRPEPAEVPFDIGEYTIPFGKKYKGKRLKDIDPFELNSFIKWLQDEAHKKNVPLNGGAKETVENAEAYLCSLEYGRAESAADAIANR